MAVVTPSSGRWVTVRGRAIFIKTGATLQQALGDRGTPEVPSGKSAVASPAEHAAAKRLAQRKIRQTPVPTREAVAKARQELRAGGRPGGESRGGGSADRRRQRQNLFKEFGGETRGYVVCPWSGIKMHWTDDKAANPRGYPTFERGKVFTKVQGGGYQLLNLLPESFTANRSRGDRPLRKENLK